MNTKDSTAKINKRYTQINLAINIEFLFNKIQVIKLKKSTMVNIF